MVVPEQKNMIPNPTGRFGLTGWTKSVSSNNWIASRYGDDQYYYYIMNANANVSANEEWYLESEAIACNAGVDLFISGRVNTARQTSGEAGFEVVCFNILKHVVARVRLMTGAGQNNWQPLGQAFITPHGTAYLKIRTVLSAGSVTTFTAWRSLKLESGKVQTRWNEPIDITMWKEYILNMQHAWLEGNVHGVSHGNLLGLEEYEVDPTSDDEKRDKHVSNAMMKILEEHLANDNSYDKNFIYDQVQPSNVWVIQHNLGKRPSVTVIDSAGEGAQGDVIYDSDNQITITFSASFAGQAILN